FGVQTMLTFNYKRAFSRIILVGSVINIILTLIMAPFYTAVGISVAMVVTEIYITLAMYLYLRGKGINLLELKRV
ncbi:MAG TPA: polysaccharide biosynthesis C-terminal domain-containing protein, partial [Methanobacteriaceae archaeon]|nr:polysaccharide biosynthesis C-terminal domain-containing protein [Methanobacteriaceae archaeon]